jgi:hypothetical protein
MTDQSEGYTFVDKRGEASAEAEAASAPVDDHAAVDEAESEGLEEFDGASSTQQLALYALGLLQLNAFQQLGLISEPKTGKAVRDLDQAKLAIDCIVALVEVLDSPGSIVDQRVRQDIRRVVTDLRLNYVSQAQMAASGK